MFELDANAAQNFLAQNDLPNSTIKKVAGDASFRSYYRISSEDKTYILMFAPPSHEDVKPFIKVAQFLTNHQFSAPKIIARDDNFGFLLLEDFGDDTYSRVLTSDSSQELKLYQKSCDCLLQLHQISAPKDLPIYNHALLVREVMLFVDWYLPLQNKQISRQDKAHFKSLWFDVIDQLSQFKSLRDITKEKEDSVVILRDYHADNLMFLPKREGVKQVGLLDFQDAVIGSKAYDLVSLLEDARRDLSDKTRTEIFNHYLKNSNCNKEDFENDYKILSLQRNIKILGIFARLATRDGKDSYLNFLPRVLNFVKLRLESESDDAILSEMANFIKRFI